MKLDLFNLKYILYKFALQNGKLVYGLRILCGSAKKSGAFNKALLIIFIKSDILNVYIILFSNKVINIEVFKFSNLLKHRSISNSNFL